MNSLELFKLNAQNINCNKFVIIFSPHYLPEKKYEIKENSKKAVIKLFNKLFQGDFIKHAYKTTKELINEEIAFSMKYIDFNYVNKGYSFGSVFDGIDNHFFRIYGIE